MHIYCTLFDCNYTARGLALIESINVHCGPRRVYVLCMYSDTALLLAHLDVPNVILVQLDELEAFDKQLSDVKSTRKPIEYYFTCKASLLRYILIKDADCERVDYLDADLFFFSSPSSLEAETANSSVALIEHRFSPKIRYMQVFGRFNAGWISIRNDDNGRRALEWWRSRCLEWCQDYLDGDRYADQKYLDRLPEFFNVYVVTNVGANLAPWNIGNYVLSLFAGNVIVDTQAVVFFHFHGLKRLIGPIFESGLALYRQQLSPVARKELFEVYLKKCCLTEKKVSRAAHELGQNGKDICIEQKRIKRGTFIRRLALLLLRIMRSLRHKSFIVSSDCGQDRSE